MRINKIQIALTRPSPPCVAVALRMEMNMRKAEVDRFDAKCRSNVSLIVPANQWREGCERESTLLIPDNRPAILGACIQQIRIALFKRCLLYTSPSPRDS